MAHYNNSHLGDEASGFTLHVGGYSSTTREELSYNNGQKFSTWDKVQDTLSGFFSILDFVTLKMV